MSQDVIVEDDRCDYNGRQNPRTVRGAHEGDCPNPAACRGCLPCPRNHCLICESRHVEYGSCPLCLTGLQEALYAIPRLYHALPTEAVDGGNNGRLEAAKPIPGGNATILHGPGSDGRGIMRAIIRGEPADHAYDETHADNPPPLQTLAWIEDETRRLLGTPAAQESPSIESTTRFLAKHATTNRPELFDYIEEIAKTANQIRSRLEAVLHDGDRDDTANVACFRCGSKLVRKSTSKPTRCRHPTPARAQLRRGYWFARLGYPQMGPTPAELRDAAKPCGSCDQGGADDRWTCSKCSRTYTDPQYNLAVRAKIEAEVDK